ncbi:hypothetical protein M404DRAFT_443822 [Pisolithus tinctorius Marx 270]|uniref:Novel STAND NTPase 1 domain-containing protein n=1 Tax=Pisolithus tinctorius Marx 270 TaxID=870435 RepID=A0A0C3NDQ7_PISTI|nr:hypothetical protein M404DRAFT_443822 [Pisolithus tinctorius Marx 270]
MFEQLIQVLPKREQNDSLAATDIQPPNKHILPATPSIFYGREKIVDQVIQSVIAKEPGYTAILGVGGMGKTSVSLAVLHHHKVVSLYGERRWFISCEAASTPQGLISTIANALNQTKDNLHDKILKFFKEQPRTLLVLDNFETPWEPASMRRDTEEILASLTSIKSLNLIVTLRGSERPLKTQWTRPFLPPLNPLGLQAARSTFISISDISDKDPNLEELLRVVDNLPLAITLMANLAQFETTDILLRRWKLERTSVFDRGEQHRLSSLEISIKISLQSPRMTQNPDALGVLRLLALLPDGAADERHVASIASNIRYVSRATSTLKQVALVYSHGRRSFRILAPIRAFLLEYYPPDTSSMSTVQRYYESITTECADIELGKGNSGAIVTRMSPEIGNIQAVLEYAMDSGRPEDVPRAIQAAIHITDLLKYSGLGTTLTLAKGADKACQLGMTKLQADSIRCQAELHYSRSKRELATAQFQEALELYRKEGLLAQEGRCLMMLGMIGCQGGNYEAATTHILSAIELHRQAGDAIGEADCRLRLAQNATWRKNYDEAMTHVSIAVGLFQAEGHRRGYVRCLWLISVLAVERRAYKTETGQQLLDAASQYHDMGDDTGEANCYRILGRMYLQTARYSDAEELLLKAIRLYKNVQWIYGEADCNQALGEISICQGNGVTAAAHFDRARELYALLNHSGGLMFCAKADGDLALQRGEHGLAKEKYEGVLRMCRSPVDFARVDFGIGNVALALGDLNKARELFMKALQVFEPDTSAILEQAQTLYQLGELELSSGQERGAEDYFKRTLAVCSPVDIIPTQADCFVKLAEGAVRQSKPEEAVARYESAIALYRQAGNDASVHYYSGVLQSLVELTLRSPPGEKGGEPKEHGETDN